VAGGAPAVTGAVPTPTTNAGTPVVPVANSAVQRAGTIAKLRTDLYLAEISSQGGDIVRLELVKHGDTEDKTRNFVLFDNGGKHVYQAQSGVIGEGLPNHKSEWKLPRLASMQSQGRRRQA
jgi:YidC/Oxa1 family membrane protein insertase